MKTIVLIFILISILNITPLSAEIEIEEVVKLYEDDDFTTRPKLYIKGDSIVVIARTKLNQDTTRKINIFFSSNSGDTWQIITNRLENREYDIDLISEYFNELDFLFVTRRKNENDTTLFYVDFDGEIVRKIKYPKIGDDHRIVFHPTDPAVLAFHVLTSNQIHQIYSHAFIYSIDYGKTWKYALPYEKVREKYGEDIGVFWSVKYKFNIRNPEKTILEYEWHNIFGVYFGINLMLNMYDDSMEIIEGLIPSSICFGCIEEDELLYKTSKSDSLIRYNIYTKSKQDYSRMEQTLHFDIDSLEINNTDDYKQNIEFKRLEYNSKNPNHQLLLIEHKELDKSKNPIYTFINQYLFQTFDAGYTWELVLTNFDKYNLISSYSINSEDLSLWLIKGIDNIPDPNSVFTKASVYRSKSPLTNIKVNNKNNELDVYLSNKILNIESRVSYPNSRIEVLNLNGQSLYKSNIDLLNGFNQIVFESEFDDQLLLIRITLKDGKSNVFKLINWR